MDITQVVDAMKLVRDGGSTGLLVTAIVGGAKGWYVWGWQYQALVEERDQWKAIALRGLSVAETRGGA
jgi:hypothetical protein